MFLDALSASSASCSAILSQAFTKVLALALV